ncbi:MAG: HAD family phosphatase [Lachnospiraceae bacterium]|nr:HAD family phosphatase [Lachnospiraceae bacterium]
MSDKKMLVLDIDGTLTNSKKEITENTKKAINDIQKDGHIIVIASGRPTAGIVKLADELDLDKFGGYVLSYNGARITNWKTKKVIYQNILDNDMIGDLYSYAKKNDLGLVTYEDNNVVTGTRHDEYIELEARINGIPIKDVDNFVEFVDFDVNKCLFTAPLDTAKEHEETIAAKFKGASVYRSEPFFIEVMPQGVDKAASLDKLVNILGMNQKDTICCGDGFNDLSMIKYAGVGVAMENAQEQVKKEADFITKSNDDDGIVHVINTFFKEKTA